MPIRLCVIALLFGFVSGIPSSLAGSTLQAWMTTAGFDIRTIGLASLVGLPYSFRFLWAPFLDHLPIIGSDRRRSCLLLLQISLIVIIIAMATMDIHVIWHLGNVSIPAILVLSFFLTFFSSSQDVLINAYQIEMVSQAKRGLSAAVSSTGWRIGAIVSGSVAMIIAKHCGWELAYLLMALLMLLGLVATIAAPPSVNIAAADNSTGNGSKYYQILWEPVRDLAERYSFKTLILFCIIVLTYKASNALTVALSSTFLIRELGFDLETVGLINKSLGMLASVLGGLAAGWLLLKMSLYRGLMIFGLCEGLGHIGYILLAYYAKNTVLLLSIATIAENWFSGMGTVGFVAFIMSLCNPQYAAGQFAMISSLSFVVRTIAGPVAAYLVAMLGWFNFFIICLLSSLPVLFFIYAVRRDLKTTE